ncbi:MAG: helix-turn-helix transcriptional regulator [Bacteroidota bacterium]
MSRIPQLVLDKKAKDGKDYKNREIAVALNMSESMVSRFLRDKVDIGGVSYSTARVWADWLDCDMRDLATLDNTDK